MSNGISFFKEFISGDLHFLLTFFSEFKTLDNIPPSSRAYNWIREAKSLGYSIMSSGDNTHVHPSSIRTINPIMDMIHSSITSRSCTRKTSQFNNLSSSLLDVWNESAISPFLCGEACKEFSLKGCVVDIWVHSSRMVTEDSNVLNISYRSSEFGDNLTDSSVLVKSSQCRERT